MRKALGAASVVAVVLLAFACSPSSSHPPVEGCVGAGCAGSGGGGSGSSGSGGSSGASSSSGSSGGTGDDASSSGTCGAGPSPSQCTQCMATSCCTQLQGCVNDPTCESIIACVAATCSGGSTCPSPSCVTNCENKFLSARSLYEAIHDNCECTTCSTKCSQLGVGDPCATTLTSCNPNLSCNGSWCTRSCSSDADCAGVGANNGNYLGIVNACIHTSGGLNTCAPGCTTAQDCGGFPGTTCVGASDIGGSTVFVCGAAGDASSE